MEILLKDVITKNTSVEDFEIEHDFPLIGQRILLVNARMLSKQEQQNLEKNILVTFKDITSWKHAEMQIAFQANILSQINDAVLVIDNDHQIIYWNSGAERLYGWKKDEMIGKKLTESFHYQWLHIKDQKNAHKELAKLGTWRGKTNHITKTGEKIHVESMVTRMIDENGAKTGFLAVMRDISK